MERSDVRTIDRPDSTPPGPADRSLAILRIALGAVWLANLAFILLPANQFFPTFDATASSFGSSSLIGGGFPGFVAANAGVFSVVIAVATTFLAVSFLLGVGVRPACVIGGVFSGALLVAQWNTTFLIPGGTDVGPHPLYLIAYLALGLGDSTRRYSVPAIWAAARNAPNRALERARAQLRWRTPPADTSRLGGRPAPPAEL